MPCDTIRRPNQTIEDRKSEIRKTVETVTKGLATGRVKVVVGKNGGIAFAGLTDEDRNRVTDACIYRRIIVGGSALAQAAIARAEAAAGRSVSRQTVAQGAHSHDGGQTWHDHKG